MGGVVGGGCCGWGVLWVGGVVSEERDVSPGPYVGSGWAVMELSWGGK